jgi:hypothetical protein
MQVVLPSHGCPCAIPLLPSQPHICAACFRQHIQTERPRMFHKDIWGRICTFHKDIFGDGRTCTFHKDARARAPGSIISDGPWERSLVHIIPCVRRTACSWKLLYTCNNAKMQHTRNHMVMRKMRVLTRSDSQAL